MRFATNRPDSFDYTVERTCKSCQNAFSGRYCNRCGERVTVPGDKSVTTILMDIIQGFTFLDSKVLRTLKLMFLRTGELTRNFMDGIRVPFLKPISVFFLANLLYFLIPSFDTFNSTLQTQMHFLPHSSIVRDIVGKRLAREEVTLEQFTLRYQQHSTNMAKMLLIIYVLMVAAILSLINYSSRNYFYDHLLAALEFTSMLILVGLLLVPWVLIAAGHLWPGSTDWLNFLLQDSIYTGFVGTWCFIVFYQVEKRVYLQSPGKAAIKALLMMPGLYIAIQCYRIVLFFITISTL